MSAIMQILGWRAEGLRCPDHEIDFGSRQGDLHSVSLIQMPNGTGKTTTLKLLRAALSGSAANGSWDGQDVRELRKLGADLDHGSFEVWLRLNEHRVTIIMDFDFENSRVRYKTTHGDGQKNGFDPPFEFRRYMTDNFVKFFVFDGELADHLLDREHVQAEEVVENLFQVNTLRTMESKVSDHWDRLTQKANVTEKTLTRRQNRLNDLRQHLQVIKDKKSRLENERAQVSSQLEKRQEAYEQEIKKEDSRAQVLDSLESDASDLKSKVREGALDVLDTMRAPHAISPVFARELHALKAGLDRVKLPESAAREFFQELAEEAECVCGRPIDEHTRDVIRNRSHQYLGSDDVSLLNSMKTAIHGAVAQSCDAPEADLREKIVYLSETVEGERAARNEIDHLQQEAEHSDPAVQEARDEIEKLLQRLSEIDKELEKFSSKDTHRGDGAFDVEVIEKRLEEAESSLAEITQTMELKEKRDILTTIVQNAYSKAREGILREVRDDTNERIGDLLPNNRIRIRKIDRCLTLEGQGSGSAGENLSVAYAFLATLFDRSEQKLPFVVDSPAGPIDLGVRPKIGELIPRLTRQFIAFTISSERAQFTPKLKQASPGGVQFITLFRKGPQDLEEAARRVPEHVETTDGLLVPGESFFNAFQLEEEAI
ncbi:AAA family ATPase [Streptomyces chartreusis]|uniref:AAA family ATPase n=1 Tax=Streptomyces chartreusis TaxID=1969 RepID=UPI0038702169|nr:AAA family ATPase [Streptomyces chartreusis]